MLEILALAFVLLACAYCGARIEQARSIDYKQRWLEALQVIEDGSEDGEPRTELSIPNAPLTVVDVAAHTALIEYRDTSNRPRKVALAKGDTLKLTLPEPPKETKPAAATITYAQLRRLAGWQRVDIEISHLKAGGSPRDPLDGLAGWHVADIMRARAKYGWTE